MQVCARSNTPGHLFMGRQTSVNQRGDAPYPRMSGASGTAVQPAAATAEVLAAMLLRRCTMRETYNGVAEGQADFVDSVA